MAEKMAYISSGTKNISYSFGYQFLKCISELKVSKEILIYYTMVLLFILFAWRSHPDMC